MRRRPSLYQNGAAWLAKILMKGIFGILIVPAGQSKKG